MSDRTRLQHVALAARRGTHGDGTPPHEELWRTCLVVCRPALLAGALAVVLALIGCGHRGPNAQLVAARTYYRDAAANPAIVTNAGAQLHQAQQTLERAEREWRDDADEREAQHLAYVAERQVDIARAVANKKVASQQATVVAEQRTEVVLRAREQEVQALREQLRTLQTRETERGIVLTVPDVLFEVDRAELTSGAQRELLPMVRFLQDDPDQTLLIEGHTDNTGPEQYNYELSTRRARAVETFLLRNGIDPTRVEVRGLGESYPVASNATTSGRQQNRRVDIVLLNFARTTETGRLR